MKDITNILKSVVQAANQYDISKLVEKYKGSEKEQIMKSIFNYMDYFDRKPDGCISMDSENTFLETAIWAKWFVDGSSEPTRFTYLINIDQIKSVLGNKDITEDDVERAFLDLKELTDNTIADDEPIYNEYEIEKLVGFLPPKEVLDILNLKEIISGEASLNKCNINGEVLYKYKTEVFEYIIHEDGAIYSSTEFYNEGEIEGEYGYISSISSKENGITVENYYRGLKITLEENNRELLYGKTAINYKDGVAQNIVINKGLPNETKYILQIDNGQIKDIILPQNSILKFNENDMKNLRDALNRNKVLGIDFELKNNGYSLEFIDNIQ